MMHSATTLLGIHEPSTWTHEMSYEAIINTLRMLDSMMEHQLEASRIEDTSEGFLIIWEGGFNETRRVQIACYNSGKVEGIATDTNEPEWHKTWGVSGTERFGCDFWCRLRPTSDASRSLGYHSAMNPAEYPLRIDIHGTMEYIRHFIWADHKNI